MNNKIILLCGESGSGKTTVATLLEDIYGMKQLQSYTTRPPRFEGETGHIFITEEEFDNIKPEDMVAYTKYNGYRYCGTSQQVDQSDVYVIDLLGIQYFINHYKGNKEYIIVYLYVPENVREERMKGRGDNIEAIRSRKQYDSDAFENVQYIASYSIINEDSRLTAQEIRNLAIEENI